MSLAGVGLALGLRLLLDPVLGDTMPFLTLFAAVSFAAWYGGRGPALAVIVVGGLAVDYAYFEPRHTLAIGDRRFQVGLFVYAVLGLASVYMFESLARSRDRAFQEGEKLRVTLGSIGDGVITTDASGFITELNGAAEALTGWTCSDARGQSLERVFHIVHEVSRKVVPNPVQRVLELGVAVGLANHTVLIAKDGRECPIDDSAAPIRNDSGTIIGAILVFRNVAAQRDGERAKEEVLSTLKSLVASAPVGIAILDRQMRFVHVNAPLAEMNGIPAEEHVGKALGEVVPDLLLQLSPIFANLMETGEAPPIHVIEGVTPKEPRIKRAWRESWFPIRGSDGHITGAGVIVDEITEQRRAEERFRASQEASLFGFASLSAVRDADGRIVDFEWDYVNPAAAALVDRPASEFVGRRLLDVVLDPELKRDLFERYVEVVESCVPQDYELWYRGEGFHCLFRNTTVKLGDGVAVSFADVTEQHLQQELLRRSEARFRQLAEAMPHIVWEADPSGRRVYINRQWSILTGRDTEAGLSDRWLDSVHPEDKPGLRAKWTAALTAGTPYTAEYRLVHKDGGHRWMMVRAVPIQGDDGQPVRWYGSSTDIDAQMQLAEALAEADSRKDEFLATLAHELRNPLAPLRNGLELMKRAAHDPRALESWREMMSRQLAHLVRLVDDLLDVSRISRGKIEVRKERVELAVVIQHAVETSRSMIEEHGHQLVVELPPEPIHVDGDVTRLAQVVANLLNNAAKYTEPDGHIWLTAKRSGGEVIVSVRDDGIGIPPAMLPKLFSIFTQVDQSLERSQGGLGIGLSLVKALVELHEGRVEARSEGLGKGAEFVVVLPIAQGAPSAARVHVPRPEAPVRERTAKSRLRILIVDDNRDGADTLARVLGMMGNETRAAYDGAEAVEVAETFRPDVVLLDLGLPKLNGFEACQHLRRRPWGKDVVIFAVTGWGQEQIRRRSQEAGFDQHVVKPVDPAALMELLVEASSRTGGAELSG